MKAAFLVTMTVLSTLAALSGRVQAAEPPKTAAEMGIMQGFPPTLIQVGTKEIFLSNAVRHYQALDNAGIEVKLDPYEGMWHVFQAFNWNLPESDLAPAFLEQQLGE